MLRNESLDENTIETCSMHQLIKQTLCTRRVSKQKINAYNVHLPSHAQANKQRSGLHKTNQLKPLKGRRGE